jgi:hypothetical protein
LEERRGGKIGLIMFKERGDDKEKVKNLEERKKKRKGLRMLKKRKHRKS